MNSFAVLADPVRRRIIELLSTGEHSAGYIGEGISREFSIGQPAVSNQLRALREADVVSVRAESSHRFYSITPGGLDDVADWVERYSRLWPQRLDALETELLRGRSRESAARTDEGVA